MEPPASEMRRARLRSAAVGAVAVVGLIAVVWVAWERGWLMRLADHDQLVRWMNSGPAGPLICIGIQFLQVVIFLIPGEITQIAAGYVFGAWWGFAYSIVGILLGAAFDFGFSRAVGRPAVQRIVGRERLAGIDNQFQSRKGLTAVFVLFVLPGMPKDALSFAAGLTAMRFSAFMGISLVARSPALLLSTLFGAEAYNKDFKAMVWIGSAALALLAVAAIYRWRNHVR